ncbi:LacI family DNA-binding transcriptional regulator [Micrococcales bacterium 31B]|nr:LacI family DNA-binding transcriptional regulator [Micrococcales bacterium 31B]
MTVSQPRKRPTIRDVAARAGVSKSLVSLHFAGGGVSPERRERIVAAAAELGFRPNLTARTLSAADGGFTAILTADLANSVFAEIVDAARAELARHGSPALLTSAMLPDASGVPTLDEHALAIFGDLRPRSLLVVGSIPDLAALTRLVPRTPLVVASGIGEQVSVAATVRTDDAAGMRLVVDHLVAQGHRRIAHIGGRGGVVATRRESAYRDAMRAHGLEAEIRVAASDFTELGGYAAARTLLFATGASSGSGAPTPGAPHPPTAIAAVNDLAALGAQAAWADVGPRDSTPWAVTGYDDSALAKLRQVDLTSVNPFSAEIGREAARCVVAVEAGESPSPSERLVAPQLVVRGSSSPTH